MFSHSSSRIHSRTCQQVNIEPTATKSRRAAPAKAAGHSSRKKKQMNTTAGHDWPPHNDTAGSAPKKTSNNVENDMFGVRH